jgi:2,3-bisphosphoglycerate-independent phosphoglycerate mutase
MKKPLVLMILDGFGINPDSYGNAIQAARTPHLDTLFADWPHTQIMASGLDVGLPEGQMGNSEVGHTNIGAGRIVYQELTRITKAAQTGELYQNPVLLESMTRCKQTGSALHLMGLLSDGGVHSHNSHLYALLQMAKQNGLTKVWVHCFTDGRDVPPHSGKDYIIELQQTLRQIGVGQIATISGRYYAMDRDNRWERVQKAYSAMVYGKGTNFHPQPETLLPQSYQIGITDEFLPPTVCAQNAQIQPGDAVVCFNFRPDRVRQITRALVDPAFTGFARDTFFPLDYVCMTQYDANMPNVKVAFCPQQLTNTFGEWISQHGLRQLRIAETEKYPHVTFFFNGGVESLFPAEDRLLIPSPKVATYDLQPQMSAYELTEELLARLARYDVIILNYANCDMVGHTGVLDAAIKAVETVDLCVGRVVTAVQNLGGVVLLTADHGNAETMCEPDGSPFTAHTTNPVPFVVVGCGEVALLPPGQGRLADIAPTMLKILDISPPVEMSGRPIIL